MTHEKYIAICKQKNTTYRSWTTGKFSTPQTVTTIVADKVLWEQVNDLQKQVQELKAELSSIHHVEKMVEIKEIKYEDALKLIENYIMKNGSTSMEELQDKLNLSMETIFNATNELEKKKKIVSRELK